MHKNEATSFDDDDFYVVPPPLKGPTRLIWVVLGIGGMVGLLFIGILFLRSQRMAVNARFEAESQRAEVEAVRADESAVRIRAMEQTQAARMRAIEEKQANEELLALPDGFISDVSKKLAGKRLKGEGVWSFSADRFILTGHERPLPEDLLIAVVGAGKTASRIEGKWRLEGDDDWMLVLTGIQADGKDVPKEGRLKFSVAGRARLNIGAYEYTIVTGKP